MNTRARRSVALITALMVIFVGVALGIPLGTWWLRWGDARFLLIVLGIFLVAVGGTFLLYPTCI